MPKGEGHASGFLRVACTSGKAVLLCVLRFRVKKSE